MSIDISGGTSFEKPSKEVWSPTVHIAFIEVDGKKVLHQLWQSQIGRTKWRPVVEIAPEVAREYW